MKNKNYIAILTSLTPLLFLTPSLQAAAPRNLPLPHEVALNPALEMTEVITSYAYNENNGQFTLTTTPASYNNKGPIPTAAHHTIKSIADDFSGNTLVNYHGLNNKDTTTYQRDALGRIVAQANNEQGHAQPTLTTFRYPLTVNGNQIIMTQLNDDGSVYYSTTQYYNPLGNKYQITDSVQGTSPLQTLEYNDLNQQTRTTDLQGNTQTLIHDAQGRITTESTLEPLGKGATRTLSKETRYDDVASRITDWQHGELHTTDGLPDTQETTGQHIQQRNDDQQITSDTLNGTASKAHRLTDTLVSVQNDNLNDNFGNLIKQSSNENAIPTSNKTVTNADTQNSLYHYDATNNLTQTLILARDKTQHPDDETLQITNTYDLQGNLTTKKVNAQQNYHYFYDANNEKLAEYRCTQTDCSQSLHQTYDYSQGTADGYTLDISGWTADEAHQKLTYGDINGEKTLLKKTVGATTYTYEYSNYHLAKPTKVTKTVGNNIVSQITYNYRPDGLLLSQRTEETANQPRETPTSPTPIVYTYCTKAQGQNNIDKLCQKTDAAGLITHYQYNGEKITTTISLANTTIPIASTTQTYGALNERLSNDRYDYPTEGQKHNIDSVRYQYNDPFNRLTDILYDNKTTLTGTDIINHLHYRYQDAQGQNTNHIMEKTASNDTNNDQTVTTDYLYNNNEQLTQSTTTTQSNQQTDTINTHYHYQNQDNPTAVTIDGQKVSQAKGIELIHGEKYQYRYNALDQLTHVTQPNGLTTIRYKNGNMQNTPEGSQLTYDEENHEASFTDAKGVSTQYTYDANGLRNSKSQNNTTTLRYIYDDAEQLSAIIETQGKDTGDKVAYLNDGDTQARIVLAGDTVKQVQFLQKDTRGTTLNTLTMADGKANIDNYQYADNGALRETTADSSTTLNVFYNEAQFDFHDQETGKQGIDYKRARSVYNFVGVTRFIEMDYGIQERNLYQFAHNNVNDYTDRTGHYATTSVVGFFAGSLAAGAFGGLAGGLMRTWVGTFGVALGGAVIGAGAAVGMDAATGTSKDQWLEDGLIGAGIGGGVALGVGSLRKMVSESTNGGCLDLVNANEADNYYPGFSPQNPQHQQQDGFFIDSSVRDELRKLVGFDKDYLEKGLLGAVTAQVGYSNHERRVISELKSQVEAQGDEIRELKDQLPSVGRLRVVKPNEISSMKSRIRKQEEFIANRGYKTVRSQGGVWSVVDNPNHPSGSASD